MWATTTALTMPGPIEHDELGGFHMTDRIRQCLTQPLIPQRSEAWFDLRRKRITGSMCDTLLGSNPFQSWEQLVAEKAGMPVEFVGNEATQHGIDHEYEAIVLYEKKTGRRVAELGLKLHATESLLAHSPDGISLVPKACKDANNTMPVLLEVKCPFRRVIKKGTVPKYYMGQLQLGMYVFDVQEAHFVQYRPSPLQYDMTIVRRDSTWLEKNMPLF
jgi:putative phage-type endonuclease